LLAELLLRFVMGGVVVSSFAFLGDMFKPEKFWGLFGAAPSVALASLRVAIVQHGRNHAATEARSMIFGAVAFFAYASCLSWTIMLYRWSALSSAIRFARVWLAIAMGLWWLFLR
jgi:Protein of unknown function (DUF3147)